MLKKGNAFFGPTKFWVLVPLSVRNYRQEQTFLTSAWYNLTPPRPTRSALKEINEKLASRFPGVKIRLLNHEEVSFEVPSEMAGSFDLTLAALAVYDDSLVTVIMAGCKVTGALADLATSCPKLRHLDLSRTEVAGTLAELQVLPCLEVLNLKGCGQIKGTLNELGGCRRLKSLSLPTTVTCERLADLTGELGNLELLELSGCAGVNGPVTCVVMAWLSGMTKHDLSGCGRLVLGCKDARAFGDLREIRLGGMDSLEGSLNGFCALPALEVLDLNGCAKLKGSLTTDLTSLAHLRQLLLVGCTSISGMLLDVAIQPWMSESLEVLGLPPGIEGDVTELPDALWSPTLRRIDCSGCGNIAGTLTLSLVKWLSTLRTRYGSQSVVLEGAGTMWFRDGFDFATTELLERVDLSNIDGLGGEMSVGLVGWICAIRAAHGSDAVDLSGCGEFEFSRVLTGLSELADALPHLDLQNISSLRGELPPMVLALMSEGKVNLRGCGPFTVSQHGEPNRI